MPRQGKGGEQVGIRLLAPEDGVRGERPRAQRGVGRGECLPAAVIQHAPGRVPSSGPSLRDAPAGRADLDRLRAVEAGVGRPEKVVEHHPRLPLAGELHGHAGQAQLLDIKDRVQYADNAALAVAFLVRDGSAVVDGIVFCLGHDAQRAVTGGDVLRREIVEHILREAKAQQLLPDRRRLRLR